MVFFGVFLRESARTAAKSRTNISTNSEKATKRLSRLAPNVAHKKMCKFMWEWIYVKQIAPRDTRRHLGVLEGQQFKSLGKLSDWHQLWFTSADSSVNGHRLNTSRHSIPRGHLGGGVRVSQIQKSGEDVKRLDRLPPKLAHIWRSIWEWIYAKQIAHWDSRGALGGGGCLVVKHSKVLGSYQTSPSIPHVAWGGGRGSHIQKSGEAVKRLHRLAPNLGHVWGFVWNEHRLNTIRLTIPQGHFGFLGGHKIKCPGKLSNCSTDWHQIWYISADSSGNGHSWIQFAPQYHRGHFGGF